MDVWVRSNDTVGHDLRLVQLDIRNETAYEQLLTAGGTFTQAGGVIVWQIAVLEGGAWSPLGADGGDPDGTVLTIVNFDDGTCPVRYVGGSFDSIYDCTTCPPITAANIAVWNGVSWNPVGDGFDRTVRALAVYDDGTGPALYAAGDFFYSGSTVVRSIAKWNGVAWSPAGYFGDPANALSAFDDGSGAELYIGGDFTHAFWDPMVGIAKWDSNQLAVVADDLVLGVNTLTVFDDGNGATLYAGGFFTTSSTQPLDLVGRLDGNTWMPLGTGINGSSVQSSGVFAAPGGDVLVVGGVFSQAGGVAASNVAQWDGISWSALGAGTDGAVNALISYDDGTGQSLYVGGDFQFAGGESRPYIAMWDGTEWSDVTGGMSQTVDVFAIVDGDPMPDITLPATFDFVSTAGYFVWSNLPFPALAFTGSSPNSSMLHLGAQGSLYIGSFDVVLPIELGSYDLDVMNVAASHPGLGAAISFGFGSPTDEPVTTWGAITGELVGGSLLLDVVPPPPVVAGAGARYLAVTPPAGPDPVALLVTPLCPGGAEAKYVGAKSKIAPHGFFAVLVDDPNDAAFLLPVQWGTVRITGVEVTPLTSYDVQTESLNGVLSAPGSATTWRWGDVNNDTFANINDALLVNLAFQGDFTNVTFAGADLAPPISVGCFPANRIINVNDTSAAISAFQGFSFPCPVCP